MYAMMQQYSIIQTRHHAMNLLRFDDPATFYDYVEAFLLQNEAANNMVLGLALRLCANPDPYNSGLPAYMALVEVEGEIVGAAVRTPPHGMIFSLTRDDSVMSLFAGDLYQLYGSLPSAAGPKSTSKAFAEHWQSVSAQQSQLYMEQRIYQLTAVKPVVDVPGSLREATLDDRDLIVDWTMGFNADALDAITREEAEAIIDAFFQHDDRHVFLWEVDGQPMSMTGATGRTPNGIRVNLVYTPPQLRGRGYASACVAAVSQQMLDSGRRFCFLYTDLANPTSNHIYQNIGYEPVCDIDMYRFISPAVPAP